MLVANMPPINTITGDAAITKGCTKNSNQTFLGRTNNLCKAKKLKINNARVMIIFVSMVDPTIAKAKD